MSTTRRSFLAALGAAAGALACDDAPFDTRRRIPRIGIQLYTMRAETAKDLRGTLQRLAAIGYREVETAGTYVTNAPDLRRILGDVGLAAPSAHLPFAAFENPATFTDARVVGHEWLTLSSPPAPLPTDAEGWRRLADTLGVLARRTKSEGFRFAYHNHAGELVRYGDVSALEILIANTDPALVSFQMDVLWTVKGGGDPRALLTRFGDRFTSVHLKDSAGPPEHAIADVGAGTIDFASVLASSTSIRNYFVEHDEPRDAYATAGAAYAYLAALRF